MKKLFAPLVGFCFILLGCNNDADTTNERTDTSTTTNTADTNPSTATSVVTDEKSSTFLIKVANSGMAEVQLAKLAQQKATMDAVKNFATMLESDHKAVIAQVKTLAQSAKRRIAHNNISR